MSQFSASVFIICHPGDCRKRLHGKNKHHSLNNMLPSILHCTRHFSLWIFFLETYMLIISCYVSLDSLKENRLGPPTLIWNCISSLPSNIVCPPLEALLVIQRPSMEASHQWSGSTQVEEENKIMLDGIYQENHHHYSGEGWKPLYQGQRSKELYTDIAQTKELNSTLSSLMPTPRQRDPTISGKATSLHHWQASLS